MSLLLRTGLVCLLVMIFSGCRSLRDRESDFSRVLNEPAPVPEKVQESFGVVGVVTAGDPARFDLEQPRSFPAVFGAVAVRSFVALEKNSRDDDADLGDETRRLLFVSAVSLAAGVVGGVFNSVPASELRRGQLTLAEALKAEPLGWGIETQLSSQARSRQIPNLKPIPAPLLPLLQPAGSTNLDTRVLLGQEIDSVLVIKLEQYGFVAQGKGNPPLVFAALVDVDVLRVDDGSVLHTGSLIYRSSRHHFNRWVAQDARLFRDELEHARRFCAEVMLDQLFRASPPPAAYKGKK